MIKITVEYKETAGNYADTKWKTQKRLITQRPWDETTLEAAAKGRWGSMMSKKWMSNPKPATLDQFDKAKFNKIVSQFLSEAQRLSHIVNRTEIRAGRIYFYRLHEQFGWDKPDAQFIKPLIDGKYAEFPLARITVYDTRGERCEADWQRHTGQWMSIFQGNITECLAFIEQNEQWFE